MSDDCPMFTLTLDQIDAIGNAITDMGNLRDLMCAAGDGGEHKKRSWAFIFDLLHDKIDALKADWDAAMNSNPAPQKAPADVVAIHSDRQ